MFAVHGIDFNTFFTCKRRYKSSARNKSLLVRKSNILSCIDCRQSREKSHHSHNRIQYDVALLKGRSFTEPLHTAENLCICIRKAAFKLAVFFFVIDADIFRSEFSCLLFKKLNTAVCGKSGNFKSVLLADVKRLCSY